MKPLEKVSVSNTGIKKKYRKAWNVWCCFYSVELIYLSVS